MGGGHVCMGDACSCEMGRGRDLPSCGRVHLGDATERQLENELAVRRHQRETIAAAERAEKKRRIAALRKELEQLEGELNDGTWEVK